MDGKIKLEITNDCATSTIYIINEDQDEQELASPKHTYHVAVKEDEASRQSLDTEIKSEPPESKFNPNVIYIKPEPLETEALYIKTEIDQSNSNQTKTFNQVDSFLCDLCNGKFATQANLRRHLKIHIKGKMFQCSVCEYKCRGTAMLQQHNLETHTEEKPFKCTLCDFRCARKNNLPPHMKIHTGVKPFQCTICDYKGTYKTNLQEHMKTHTGEKPFKCNVCDNRFRHKISLKRHATIHTGEKPFQCSLCDYKCARKSNLHQHMRTHTGEKPFTCSICNDCFTHKISLNRHMETHSEEKPF